jgi:hypothetical protein
LIYFWTILSTIKFQERHRGNSVNLFTGWVNIYESQKIVGGVGTSTIRTSTGQKFQNVEMVFLVDQNIENQKDQNVENVFWVDHYYDITTSKMAFELITTSKRMKRTSKISILSDFYILTTYGVISTTYGIWFCERLALKNESLKTL